MHCLRVMYWQSGHPLLAARATKNEFDPVQSFYPECFEREMACTEVDWLRWLPAAVGNLHSKVEAGAAGVRLGDGALGLKWQEAAPRVIGLVQMPVLQVSFRFAGVEVSERQVFMKRFDLYMQRGGG